jgi:hypothetical protein
MKKRQNKTVEGAERNDNFWKWIGKKIIRQMVMKEGWDGVEGIRPKRCYDNIVKRGGGRRGIIKEFIGGKMWPAK